MYAGSMRFRGWRRSARNGATLVEVLVALAITAALLTAVGFALDASVQGYQINQAETTLANRARLTLHRMLANIRSGDAHEPYAASAQADFASGLIVSDTGISFDSDDGHATVYRYDPANKRLIADVDGVAHVLLDGVDGFSLKLEPMKSATHIRAGLSYDLLRRVTILLTIHDAGSDTPLPGEVRTGQTLTVSSSAVPRRNAW
jgi:type II secretory pathway pseudopilin PulG